LSGLADRLSASPADFDCAAISSDRELLAAIRKRIDQLELTHEVVEELAGLPRGYGAKVWSDTPPKRISAHTLFWVLQSLGLRMRLEVDPALVAKLQHRWVPRKMARPSKIMWPSRQALAGANNRHDEKGAL
jgi:hypothetical protein